MAVGGLGADLGNMAGEPVRDIARKAGTTAVAVGAYESVFYDVRHRLWAVDFVAARLLGPAGPGDEVGAAWRLLGFVGGPVVLDAVIGGRTTAARPGRPEDVAAFLTDTARAAVAGHLAAVLSRGADPATRAALVKAAAVALAGRREDPAGRRSAIEMHIQAMFDDIPWGVGTDAEAAAEARCPALAAADRLGAELRDDEAWRLATGEAVPGLADLPDKLSPPRRERASVLTAPPGRPEKR